MSATQSPQQDDNDAAGTAQYAEPHAGDSTPPPQGSGRSSLNDRADPTSVSAEQDIDDKLLMESAAAGATAAAGGSTRFALMRELAGSSFGSSGKAQKMGSKMAPPAGPGKLKNLENLRNAITNLEQMLHSESSDVQLEATKRFRQLLSVDRDPMGSVQDMLDQNIVPQLLRFLKKNDNAALQVEALWALTNIAAGTTEHTHLLIKNDAVSTLVALLDSTHQEVLEQAVWVLGNIAGDGTNARDTVLQAGALEPLLKCMRDNRKISLLRIATWTLSNLCDGQPRPVFKVGAVLHTIREVLQIDDTEVLSHACWALSHLCDGPSPHIQAVVKADVCSRLVELLHCKSWRVVKPALRTVGNIVCAEDEQDYTQQIIECGAVPCLRLLIKHSNREIQKEACWTLSNIAAGTIDQIQCVLDSGSIPTLVELASKDASTDPDVRIEACWVLLNATSCGSDSQIQFLVNAGCISVLCTLLDDNTMVMMALEGLEKILQVGHDQAQAGDVPQDPNSNLHTTLLDTEKIEALQRHRSSAIAKRATRMWNQYFVVCAICNTPYSKNSPATKFCSECKCNVCNNCNCTVYHLSYQDELWKSFAEDEKNKQQPKKGKKKKKKAKDKDKKKKDAGQCLAGDGHDHGESAQPDADAGGGQALAVPDQADLRKNNGASGESGASRPETAARSVPTPGLAVQAAAGAPAAPLASSSPPPEPAMRPKINGGPLPARTGKPTPKLETFSPANFDKNNGDEATAMGGGEGASQTAPDYVEFLSNNGSIVDLWKMINENENSKTEDSPVPLETSSM